MTTTFYCYKDLTIPDYLFNKASTETRKELLANGWEKHEWDLIDCLKHNYESPAIFLYHKIHDTDAKKSTEMVRKIAQDMGIE